jgi:hypothetical protein
VKFRFALIAALLFAGPAWAQGIGVPNAPGGPEPADLDRLFYGITATPSGTQSTSLILQGTINVVTTVGTAADGVLLPPCTKAPRRVMVMNEAASNAMQLFASGSETIDGTAGATGISIAAATRKDVICVKPTFGASAGIWFTH